MELCPFMCYGHLVTRNLTFNLWSWQVLFRKSFFIYVQPRNKFHIDSQDSGLRTYSQSHPILNMNIKVNIQSQVVMSLIMSSWSKWFHFTYFAMQFIYPKSNWSYHVQNIDFENSWKTDVLRVSGY